MYTVTASGKEINLISTGPIEHTINDNPDTKLKDSKAALLVVQEQGDIKVTFLNGKTKILIDYDNYPAIYVTKVWATGTTIEHSKIQLWE